MYFAKSTGGFYNQEIHGSAIPEDAVEITEAEHGELLSAQSQGKIIKADTNGRPIAVAPPKPTAAQIWEQVKAERDRRRFEGGVKVGEYWFLSSAIAMSEYNTLTMLSVGLAENSILRADWRTMSGEKVDVTPRLVRQILTAGFAQFAAIDDAAQAHQAALSASIDPSSYDYSVNWPLIFVPEVTP